MRTLEIRTAQNVTIEYTLADVKERGLALLVDILVMLIIMLVLSIIYGTLFGPYLSEYKEYFSILPVLFFYSLVSEIRGNGTSIGKRVLGIKVVKVNGAEARISDYLIRWAFRVIDIYFSLGVLGTVMVNSTTRSQRLGDILANTTVIKVKLKGQLFGLKQLERMRTISDSPPKYREVLQMSEKEMLIIKSAIDQYVKYPNQAHAQALAELSSILRKRLNISVVEGSPVSFLQGLIRDYIVLTR